MEFLKESWDLGLEFTKGFSMNLCVYLISLKVCQQLDCTWEHLRPESNAKQGCAAQGLTKPGQLCHLDRASICWCDDKVDYRDRLVLEGCDMHLNTKKILDFVKCLWFQLATLTWGSQDVTCSGCSIILSCRLIAALVSSPVKLEALAKKGLLMSWYSSLTNMAEAPVKTVGF